MKKENVILPNPIEARGKVTLQFHDKDTNEVVKEVVFDNYIAKGVDYLYQIQMKNLYQRHKFTGGAPVNSIGDPFRMMYLTDADHDEDPDNEWLMQGNVIGQARTYSNQPGTDPITSGSYNADESFTRDNQVHLVFNFAASAANGSISSVYLGSDVSLLTGAGVYLNRTFTTTRYPHSIVKYNNLFYEFTDTSIIVSDENHTVLYGSGRPTSGNIAFRSGTIYDDHVYTVATLNNRDRALFKIPIDDLEEVVSTLNSSNFSNAYQVFPSKTETDNNLRCITYMPDRQQFAIGYTDWIEIHDLNFNILKSFNVGFNIGIGSASTAYANFLYEDRLLVHDKHVIDIDKEIVTPRLGLPGIFSGADENYIYGLDGYIYPKIGFSSRAKLSTPVTKTSSHPLTVIYDYYLPSLYGEDEI